MRVNRFVFAAVLLTVTSSVDAFVPQAPSFRLSHVVALHQSMSRPPTHPYGFHDNVGYGNLEDKMKQAQQQQQQQQHQQQQQQQSPQQTQQQPPPLTDNPASSGMNTMFPPTAAKPFVEDMPADARPTIYSLGTAPPPPDESTIKWRKPYDDAVPGSVPKESSSYRMRPPQAEAIHWRKPYDDSAEYGSFAPQVHSSSLGTPPPTTGTPTIKLRKPYDDSAEYGSYATPPPPPQPGTPTVKLRKPYDDAAEYGSFKPQVHSSSFGMSTAYSPGLPTDYSQWAMVNPSYTGSNVGVPNKQSMARLQPNSNDLPSAVMQQQQQQAPPPPPPAMQQQATYPPPGPYMGNNPPPPVQQAPQAPPPPSAAATTYDMNRPWVHDVPSLALPPVASPPPPVGPVTERPIVHQVNSLAPPPVGPPPPPPQAYNAPPQAYTPPPPPAPTEAQTHRSLVQDVPSLAPTPVGPTAAAQQPPARTPPPPPPPPKVVLEPLGLDSTPLVPLNTQTYSDKTNMERLTPNYMQDYAGMTDEQAKQPAPTSKAVPPPPVTQQQQSPSPPPPPPAVPQQAPPSPPVVPQQAPPPPPVVPQQELPPPLAQESQEMPPVDEPPTIGTLEEAVAAFASPPPPETTPSGNMVGRSQDQLKMSAANKIEQMRQRAAEVTKAPIKYSTQVATGAEAVQKEPEVVQQQPKQQAATGAFESRIASIASRIEEMGGDQVESMADELAMDELAVEEQESVADDTAVEEKDDFESRIAYYSARIAEMRQQRITTTKPQQQPSNNYESRFASYSQRIQQMRQPPQSSDQGSLDEPDDESPRANRKSPRHVKVQNAASLMAYERGIWDDSL